MTRVSLDKIQDFIRDTSYDEDISNKKNITKITPSSIETKFQIEKIYFKKHCYKIKQ